MTESFNILVNKLNAFKKKYYLYQLIRGVVLSVLVLTVIYTSFSIIEYNVYLSTEIRKVSFLGFLVFCLLLMIRFIGIPVMRLARILKPLDLKASSRIIRNHFPEIKDKLLNIIELTSLNEDEYSNELLLASIDQKIEDLKVFNFSDAIQYKNIKSVLIYLTVSILITISIFIINKSVFTDSAHRFVHYNQEFVRPAPFSFRITNPELKAKKGDAFTIKALAEGDELPQIVYVNIEGNNYLMKTCGVGEYEFEIASVINGIRFYFTDLKYSSEVYSLKLLPKPGILNFSTLVSPPAYTSVNEQKFENIGDLQVPGGTKITWTFRGIDIDSLYVVLNDLVRIPAQNNGDFFHVEHSFYSNANYNVIIKNTVTEPELALSYSVDVIPDLFPEIEVTQVMDSTDLTRFFFKGAISDDYGFSDLSFHYNIENSDSAITLPFVRNLNNQDFYFSFDFSNLPQPEGTINYYFSVSDNDVINHFKTTTSNSFAFNFPNKDEIVAKEIEQFQKLENKFIESQRLANEIQEDLKNLQFKNMQANISDWDKSQMVNDIVKKQNKLEQLYDQIKKDNENLNKYLDSFNKQNEDIVEKQKKIEELLEEVFTDELKKLMEEFSELAEDFDTKKLNKMSQNMKLTMDDLQKQLDRNLEMLQKLKIEQKIQNAIDEINEMAQEETDFAQEVSDNKNYEEIKQKVEEHKKDLSRIEEQVQQALDLNKSLEKPMNLNGFEEDFEEIDKSIEENKQNLDNKKRKKSGAGLKKTAEQMKNLAFGMQQMMDMNQQKQNQENIQNLRQILSNLILLSFKQEDILKQLNRINAKDPRLVQLNLDQKKIVDQSIIVRDSLYSLANRAPQVSNLVNNELVTLEINLKKATEQMEEGLFPNARTSQQYVVTSANNLALMLNETLENLEKQQANSQPGDQQCENPGQNSSGMQNLKESSESIKQQLQKMIEQMKKGDQGKMGKQFGQSLMQHEMMQQMLREMMNGNIGSETKNALKKIDDMLEQNRKELMNRNINAETLVRQNLITTRLLEADNAEKEREFEDKRESESADDFYSNPVKFFEYKEKENYSIEYINKNAHRLNNFYNRKYKEYLKNIQKTQ